ncbi:MAG: acyl carrier protein [Acidobacteriota bacterium]
MTVDTIEQVRAIASDVFGMFVQEESGGAPPENSDDWDSMLRLNLVLALEEHFGVELLRKRSKG